MRLVKLTTIAAALSGSAIVLLSLPVQATTYGEFKDLIIANAEVLLDEAGRKDLVFKLNRSTTVKTINHQELQRYLSSGRSRCREMLKGNERVSVADQYDFLRTMFKKTVDDAEAANGSRLSDEDMMTHAIVNSGLQTAPIVACPNLFSNR